MTGIIKFSADDHAIYVNGIPIGHFTKGRIQPDTGSRITRIEIADGVAGVNVPGIVKARPGSGNVSFRSTSPDSARLAEHSSQGDLVSVSIRVVKNHAAYSYSQIDLTHAILGPVPLGPEAEAPEIDLSFEGTGYHITKRKA